MEPKKSKKANLEAYRSIFIMLGLVIALAATLSAFEWQSKADAANYGFDQTWETVIENEIVPITRPELPKPPAPKPLLSEVLNISLDTDSQFEDFVPPTSEPTDTWDSYTFDLPEEIGEEPIFVSPERMPEFPGGEKSLMKQIMNAIVYPPMARESNIQGKVFVRFVVDKEGKVTDVTVTRSVHPLLDAEAIRAVSKLPRWKPGKQGEKNVSVYFSVPISFKLQ